MFDICIPNTDVLQECYNKKIVEIILGPNNILESQFNEQLCFIPDSVPGTLFSWCYNIDNAAPRLLHSNIQGSSRLPEPRALPGSVGHIPSEPSPGHSHAKSQASCHRGTSGFSTLPAHLLIQLPADWMGTSCTAHMVMIHSHPRNRPSEWTGFKNRRAKRQRRQQTSVTGKKNSAWKLFGGGGH